jgi:hypothetical protein
VPVCDLTEVVRENLSGCKTGDRGSKHNSMIFQAILVCVRAKFNCQKMLTD